MTEGGNDRVTLALVGQKLDALDVKLTTYCQRSEEAQESRHALDNRLVRVEERLAIYAAALMAFSVVASAIAAYIATIDR